MTAPFRPMPPELITDRLGLRLRDGRDAATNLQLLRERAADPRPSVRRPVRSLAEEIDRLDAQHVEASSRGFGLYALRRRTEGDSIGYCGLIVGRHGTDEPEIAYELLEAVHGHGYATEAAQAVVDAAHATGRARLWASVRPWNTPSLAVLRRVGFVRDHELEDEWGTLVVHRLDA